MLRGVEWDLNICDAWMRTMPLNIVISSGWRLRCGEQCWMRKWLNVEEETAVGRTKITEVILLGNILCKARLK